MTGKLFIVGVGPGDAELVTVKAARILGQVREIFVPVAEQGRESLAGSIAGQYLAPDARVTELCFPMAPDTAAAQQRRQEHCRRIEAVLRQGREAALLTLGDPCTYSTAWPIVQLMRRHAPDIAIEIVPGVTAYAHAAAQSFVCLAEGDDVLSILSGYAAPERVGAVVDGSDSVVFLKTYRQRQMLIDLLREKKLIDRCIYVRRCGLPGQEIVHDVRSLGSDCDYLSMIILKKQPGIPA